MEDFHGLLTKIHPQNFLQSLPSSTEQILSAHQQTLTNLRYFCDRRASQKEAITAIRREYSKMWGYTMKLPSNFLNHEVSQMR